MRIIVLDGYTLNPGDLSWSGLEQLGELRVFDRTAPHQVVERASGADALFTNKTVLSENALARLNALRYIGVLATGYDVVDLAAATRRNVVVTNVPTYGTRSVAQMTFALLLELCHHVQAHSSAVRDGAWTRSPDFSFWVSPLIELASKTMGIIGFGRIGGQVAEIAAAFGMKVMACDPSWTRETTRPAVARARLGDLLESADVISLHCPLVPETRGLIDARALRRMRRSAFLLNTSRGPLVVDTDLAAALEAGTIAGAALDVLSVEPPPVDNPLLRAPNGLITPHVSWATREARSRLMGIAVDNLRAFLHGEPVNMVAQRP
jgi:glycerate dehydrogenase